MEALPRSFAQRDQEGGRERGIESAMIIIASFAVAARRVMREYFRFYTRSVTTRKREARKIESMPEMENNHGQNPYNIGCRHVMTFIGSLGIVLVLVQSGRAQTVTGEIGNLIPLNSVQNSDYFRVPVSVLLRIKEEPSVLVESRES